MHRVTEFTNGKLVIECTFARTGQRIVEELRAETPHEATRKYLYHATSYLLSLLDDLSGLINVIRPWYFERGRDFFQHIDFGWRDFYFKHKIMREHIRTAGMTPRQLALFIQEHEPVLLGLIPAREDFGRKIFQQLYMDFLQVAEQIIKTNIKLQNYEREISDNGTDADGHVS